MDLKTTASFIFEAGSAIAVLLSLWVKLTIDSKLQSGLNRHKKDQDLAIEKTYVQISHMESKLSNYVTKESHKESHSEYLSLTRELLAEIKGIDRSIGNLSTDVKLVQERVNNDKEKKDEDIRTLKEAIIRITAQSIHQNPTKSI